MENNFNISDEQEIILFDKRGIRDDCDLDSWYDYEKIWIFSDELAALKVNGKWGFIDKYGNVIADFEYKKIELLTDDRIKVIDEHRGILILNELGKTLIEGNWTVIFKDYSGSYTAGSCYDFEKKMRLFIEKEKNKYDKKNEYERRQEEDERQHEEDEYERKLEVFYDHYDKYCSKRFFNSVELKGKFFVEYKNKKEWCIYDYDGNALFYVSEILSNRNYIYRVVNIQNEYNKKREVVKFDNDWSKFEKHSNNESEDWSYTQSELDSMYRDALDNNPDAVWNID